MLWSAHFHLKLQLLANRKNDRITVSYADKLRQSQSFQCFGGVGIIAAGASQPEHALCWSNL